MTPVDSNEDLPEIIPDSRSKLISTRKKPRKHGVEIFVKNPFWEPTEVKVGVKKVTITAGFTHNSDSGEGIHHAGIHRIEHVDETQFVKLFTQNLKVFFELSAPSQKILQVLLMELQKTPNVEGIHLPWFAVEDFSKEHNLAISRSTYFRGLKEMIHRGLIAESENQNFYWINPHIFFNGDRMVFINEYRKFKKPEKKALEKAPQRGFLSAGDDDGPDVVGEQ